MLKIDNVMIPLEGWEAAIRGMRNPMNSWEKSDSVFFDTWDEWHDICNNTGLLGEDDLEYMHPAFDLGKLDEWRTVCDWIKSLPHAEIMGVERRVPEEA